MFFTDFIVQITKVDLSDLQILICKSFSAHITSVMINLSSFFITMIAEIHESARRAGKIMITHNSFTSFHTFKT